MKKPPRGVEDKFVADRPRYFIHKTTSLYLKLVTKSSHVIIESSPAIINNLLIINETCQVSCRRKQI